MLIKFDRTLSACWRAATYPSSGNSWVSYLPCHHILSLLLLFTIIMNHFVKLDKNLSHSTAGLDPVAVLRWSIIKTLVKSVFAFIAAGRSYRNNGGLYSFFGELWTSSLICLFSFCVIPFTSLRYPTLHWFVWTKDCHVWFFPGMKKEVQKQNRKNSFDFNLMAGENLIK